jgi:hypothetical protein
MTNLTAFNGGDRQFAGFSVYVGNQATVQEPFGLERGKPGLLLLALGEPFSVFPTKRAAQEAIAETRRRAVEEGFEPDGADYWIRRMFTSK